MVDVPLSRMTAEGYLSIHPFIHLQVSTRPGYVKIAIENTLFIVDLPIHSMVIFFSNLLTFTRPGISWHSLQAKKCGYGSQFWTNQDWSQIISPLKWLAKSPGQYITVVYPVRIHCSLPNSKLITFVRTAISEKNRIIYTYIYIRINFTTILIYFSWIEPSYRFDLVFASSCEAPICSCPKSWGTPKSSIFLDFSITLWKFVTVCYWSHGHRNSWFMLIYP